MNLPKAWNAKLGAGSFFALYKPIQEVWGISILAIGELLGHKYFQLGDNLGATWEQPGGNLARVRYSISHADCSSNL